MMIHELIERLEKLREVHGPDCEVRLMTQPTWPFETAIGGIVSSEEIHRADAERCRPFYAIDDDDDAPPEVVFILEGTQLGYGSKSAWNLV